MESLQSFYFLPDVFKLIFFYPMLLVLPQLSVEVKVLGKFYLVAEYDYVIFNYLHLYIEGEKLKNSYVIYRGCLAKQLPPDFHILAIVFYSRDYCNIYIRSYGIFTSSVASIHYSPISLVLYEF